MWCHLLLHQSGFSSIWIRIGCWLIWWMNMFLFPSVTCLHIIQTVDGDVEAALQMLVLYLSWKWPSLHSWSRAVNSVCVSADIKTSALTCIFIYSYCVRGHLHKAGHLWSLSMLQLSCVNRVIFLVVVKLLTQILFGHLKIYQWRDQTLLVDFSTLTENTH